jgi:hypothetical protein
VEFEILSGYNGLEQGKREEGRGKNKSPGGGAR